MEGNKDPPEDIVAGVEENVNSRFVDYTKATPWEHLVSEMERFIKLSLQATTSDTSHDIEYLDSHYIIKYVNLTQDRHESRFMSDLDVSLWFDTFRYFIFSRSSGRILSTSESRTLFSALISALDSCRCSLPVFISSEPLDNVHHAREVLGYQVVAPRLSEHSGGPYEGVGHAVVHFESVILDGVSRKHSFYYLDGLSKLFGAKLWKFSSGNISLSEEAVVMSAWEHYDYLPSKSSTDVPSSHSLTHAVSAVSHSQDTFLHQLRTTVAEQRAAQSELPAVVQSTLDDLLAGFPDGVGSFTPFDVPLEKLTIQLRFSEMEQSAVVDNDYYTTLLPSKLSHDCWSASAVFSDRYLSPSVPNTADLLAAPAVAPTYSSALRRLLALYVCGKSCKPGYSFRSLSGKDGSVSVLNSDKAINISSILSTDTRRAVVGLCSSMTPSTDDTNLPGVSLPQDLLMRVFSRSLYVDPVDAGDVIVENHFSTEVGGSSAEQCSQGKSDEQGSDDDDVKYFDCESPSSRLGTDRPSRRLSGGSFGAGLPMPWNWLSDSGIVASPVGSWLSLVSVYASGLTDIKSMVGFWMECMDEVRIHWESRVPIPRLYPPVPIHSNAMEVGRVHSQNFSRRHSKGEGMDAFNDIETSLGMGGIWQSPLWQDVIDKYKSTATPFMLPDVSQSLPYQKLQMINMCIICSEESAVVGPDTVDRVVSRVRAAKETSVNRHKTESVAGSEESGRDLRQEIESEYLSAEVESNLSCIHPPSLQRRLPMTTDAVAQHERLSKKINDGQSRSINDNPLLRWQISMPALLSDIRSFKSHNPDSSLRDFLEWYGGVDEQIDSMSMQELWEGCVATCANEQKPLFRAEQEAEKALGYLEGLSLAQLAAVLLSSAMTSFHMMMSCDIKLRSMRSIIPEEYDEAEDLQSDLDNIEKLIKHAVGLLEMDTPLMGTCNSAEASISQSALIAVDEVCNAIYALEVLQMKMISCRESLDFNGRLTSALSREGSVVAQSVDEARTLFSLAKCASFGGDSHTWHSFDGRELGPPSKKIFDLKCNAECNVMNALPLHPDTKFSSPGTSCEHHMRAVLENGKLRVAFKLFEMDSVM